MYASNALARIWRWRFIVLGAPVAVAILFDAALGATPAAQGTDVKQQEWAGTGKLLPASREYAEAAASISATMVREVQAMDNFDWDMLASSYTEDACFAVTIGNGQLPEMVVKMLQKPLRGPADIKGFVKAVEGTLRPNTFNHHVISNFWLEKLDGDKAVARAYVTVGSGFIGRYEEDFRRGKDGIWRISCKRVFANDFNYTPPKE
jgi:hypothetical protein